MDPYEYSRIQRKVKEERQIKYAEDSKRRLIRSIEKKFRTTFIGALDQFEKLFGESWRGNSPAQISMKKRWDEARKNILDNGNNQLRAAIKEIEEYNISWNRYRMDLPIRRRDNI